MGGRIRRIMKKMLSVRHGDWRNVPARRSVTTWGITFLTLLGLFAATPALANLTVGAISQSPQNTVTPGQTIAYRVPVSSDEQSTTDFVSMTILLNGTDVTSQFSPAPPCSHDGNSIYCNGVSASAPQTYQVIWNNPAPKPGNYQLTFQVNCSLPGATCSGDSASIKTVISAPPAAVDISTATEGGTAVTIQVLPQGQTSSSVTSVSKPGHGTAINNGDGSITYTPDSGFSGVDSFTYTLTNAAQQTSTATVRINVQSRVVAQGVPTTLLNLPGLTPNQLKTGRALVSLCTNSSDAQVQSACNTIASLSPSDQAAALQQITPDEVSSQGTNAAITSYTQLSNIRMRLMALRQGTAGIGASNLSMGVQGQEVPIGKLLAMLLKKGANGGGASADSGGDERLGVFFNGRFNFGDQSTTANQTGFNFNTYGVTAGSDYRFTENLVAGIALGFASTNNDFGANSGNMDSRDLSVSTYGSYYLPKDFFLDWIGTYVNNHYDIKHNIVFTGFNSQTQAGVGGDQLALALNAGKDFHHGGLVFTPYARGEYIKTHIDAYQENGGSGLAMAFDHQVMRYLTGVLAGRVSDAISTSWGIVSPSAHAEWVHQFENNSRLIGGHFVGDPSSTFNVRTDSPDRNYFNVGFGVVLTLPRGISAFFNYETMLARNHVSNTLMQLGGRIEF